MPPTPRHQDRITDVYTEEGDGGAIYRVTKYKSGRITRDPIQLTQKQRIELTRRREQRKTVMGNSARRTGG